MKTDPIRPPQAENGSLCSLCGFCSSSSPACTSFHTCIFFNCFWCLCWILLAYKCDPALIICVWIGDISNAILCACVHSEPKQLDWSPSIRLTFSQEHHHLRWIWCSASEMLEGLEVSIFLLCCNSCNKIPAVLLNYMDSLEKSLKNGTNLERLIGIKGKKALHIWWKPVNCNSIPLGNPFFTIEV